MIWAPPDRAPEQRQLLRGLLRFQRNRVVPREAGVAVGRFPVRHAGVKALHAEVSEGVGSEVGVRLLPRVGRRDQVPPQRGVDPVEARVARRGGADAEVDLFRPGGPDHLDDLASGRPPDDGVVHHNDPFPRDDSAHGVQLDLHAEVADRLLRLDEGAPHVVVPDEAHLEGDPGRLGVPERRGDARVGNGDDDVGVYGALLRQLPPESLADLVDAGAAHDRVRTREVDVLEDAEMLDRREERPVGMRPAGVDHDHLPRLHLPQVLRLDQVESARLGGDDRAPLPFQLPERQGADPVRVAHPDQLVPRHEEEGIRAADLVQRVDDAILDPLLPGAGDQMDDDLGVHRGLEDGAGDLELPLEFVGVHEVAVVGDRDGAGFEVDHQRLGVLQLRAARRGVPDVADRRVARESGKDLLGEDVGDQPHLLVEDDPLAVGARDPRALLAPVLQRVEAQVRHVGRFGMPVDPEDAALVVPTVGHARSSTLPGPGPPRTLRSTPSGAPPSPPSPGLRCRHDHRRRHPVPSL